NAPGRSGRSRRGARQGLRRTSLPPSIEQSTNENTRDGNIAQPIRSNATAPLPAIAGGPLPRRTIANPIGSRGEGRPPGDAPPWTGGPRSGSIEESDPFRRTDMARGEKRGVGAPPPGKPPKPPPPRPPKPKTKPPQKGRVHRAKSRA